MIWGEAVAIYGIGCVLMTLWWGLSVALPRLWVLTHGIATSGTVVRHRCRGILGTYPLVRFEANGEEVEIRGLSEPYPHYETGARIDIVFLPGNPRVGVLVTGREAFLAWTPFATGFACLTLVACYFLLLAP